MNRATTSASNIIRRLLCPGSARMEAKFRDEDTEYSKEGTMLHGLFLTGQRPASLTPDQKEALDGADFYANEFFAAFREKFQIPDDARYSDERETALVLRDPQGKEVYPGHADVCRTWPEYNVRAIVDAKFGFMEVEEASDNLQLASYAVMSHQAAPVDAIGVCIVQPRNFGPRRSWAFYDASAMPGVAAELIRIDAASLLPDAILIAGAKQCHFCKAKAACPSYTAQITAIEPGAELAVESLDNDQLVRLHLACSAADKIAKAVRHEMRERIKLAGLPGWKLQNSGDDVVCNDSLGLFGAFKSYFDKEPKFTAAAFDACRVMGWGKLETLVRDLTGLSEKKAKELIASLAEPFVTRTPKEKRVAKDKTAALE